MTAHSHPIEEAGNQGVGASALPTGLSSAAPIEPASPSRPEASIPSRVSDVLDRAADLIEPEGAWTQGQYIGPYNDCWCVLGAIQRAGNFPHDDNPAAAAMHELLGGTWLHEWNDAPERTQAEVVAKLREAAALAREQGR